MTEPTKIHMTISFPELSLLDSETIRKAVFEAIPPETSFNIYYGAAIEETAEDEELAEVDRNARAFGWEAAKRGTLFTKFDELSPENPFLDPNWRDQIKE